MASAAERQMKFYQNHTEKCICNKILKHIRENGGSPTPKSLIKYSKILTPDVLFDNFKKYLLTEEDEKIAEKKTDKFIKNIRSILWL